MKSIRTILSLAASSILLTSCFQHEITIRVKADGSGTLTEETRIGAEVLKQMEEMAAQFGGDAGKNDPVAGMLSEEKCKARASELGEGVEFVKVEKVESNGSKGAKAVYRFADISKLQVTTHEGAGAMKQPGMPAPPKDPADALQFAVTDGVLTVTMPPMDKTGPDEKAEPAENQDLQDNPEAMEMMKQMFGDMKMSMKIIAETGISSTDASHHAGDTVTLMEMDFGKLINDPENLKKMMSLNQESPAKAMDALKNIEGVKFESKPVIKIQLK